MVLLGSLSERNSWLLASVAAAFALACSLAWQRRAGSELKEAEARVAGVVLPTGQRTLMPQESTDEDFTRRLGSEAGSAVQWSRDLQRSAAQLGVSLLTLSNTETPAQVDRLGRNDVQLLLRGPYPQIKLLLKESLDRYPSTSLARLNMRSTTNVAEIEAVVVLVRLRSPASPQAATTVSTVR